MQYTPLLHVVLHEPEIPPNTGNIARTCVAVAAKLWLVELERLGERPMWFFSARASRPYTEAVYARGDAVVFGSESRGLPPEFHRQYAERMLTIPSRPQVRSLNLSNAAAVVCYEAVRQFGGLAPA